MRRHPLDPIALVFGLTFAGAGIVVLAGGSLTEEGRFLLPGCLLGLGIALLIQNASRNCAERPAAGGAPTFDAGSAGPAGPSEQDDRDDRAGD